MFGNFMAAIIHVIILVKSCALKIEHLKDAI